MKTIETVSFYAEDLINHSRLFTTTPWEKNQTLIKEEIDRSNLNALKTDHDPEQFQIIRKTTTTIFSDDGKFICRSVFENATEVYPPLPYLLPRYYVKPYDPTKSKYQCEVTLSTFDRINAIEFCKREKIDSFVADRDWNIIFSNKKKLTLTDRNRIKSPVFVVSAKH